MKRINNLYKKIISIENLKQADINARIGKLSSYGVQRHDLRRKKNITQLHQILKTESFSTSKYHVFKMITDNGKEREIYRLPYYPDRIVHHAIMNIMEPIWTSIFTSDTYSCIKGRGIHGVFRKLKHNLQNVEATQYCLKIDIRKFYPTINHAILKQLIRLKIKDKPLLVLLDEIIDSAPGVPIGNYLSQFFANIYLSYFDHWIKEVKQVKYYYRYADDMVFLSNNKTDLHTLLIDINTYLSSLNLKVKGNYQVFPVNARGIDFVGYVFRHSHILMRKSIKQSFARKAAKLSKNNISPSNMRHHLSSYSGWASHCNSKHLIKKLIPDEKISIRSYAF